MERMLIELIKMADEPFIKEYWAINLKTGRKRIILRLKLEAKE